MVEVRARDEATRACEVIVENQGLDREADWKELHWRLRSLAQQRVTLEAQEADLLLEAEESLLHKRLGYASLLEYMEHELHYGPHAANERLRVARELLSLPLIADQFRAGELSFSAVRELTRVATPDNEHLFLTKAQGKTARDVERMVSGLKRGDDPEADPDPRLIKKRIFLEVSATTFARYRVMRTAIDKSREERITDDELLAMLLDAPAGTDRDLSSRNGSWVRACVPGAAHRPRQRTGSPSAGSLGSVPSVLSKHVKRKVSASQNCTAITCPKTGQLNVQPSTLQPRRQRHAPDVADAVVVGS